MYELPRRVLLGLLAAGCGDEAMRRAGLIERRPVAKASLTGGAMPFTPPVPGFAVWFDSDRDDLFPGNPNFRYAPFTNQGTLTGSWTPTTYANRPRRHTVTYSNGPMSRQLAWNNATANRSPVFGGTASQMQFLHDGSGYTMYLAVTPRATTLQRIFHTCTASTARGCLFTNQNAQQRFSAQIGNGAAQVINQQTTGSTFSTDVPHIVTVKIHPYGGIGTDGCTIRVDDTTFTTTLWLATPDVGNDAATTAKMGDTWNGHYGAVLIYKDSDVAITLGDANDTLVKAALTARFVGTPNAWTAPVNGVIVFEGDSITLGTTNGASPWTEMITLSEPFELFMVANAGDELGPAATPGTILNDYAGEVAPNFNGAAPFNIGWCWGGSNDITAGTTSAITKGYYDDWVAGAEATGFTCCVASMLNRTGLTAGEQTERGLFNTAVAADKAGAAGYFDAVAYLGDGFAEPDFQADGVHPSTAGNIKLAAGITPVLEALLP